MYMEVKQDRLGKPAGADGAAEVGPPGHLSIIPNFLKI